MQQSSSCYQKVKLLRQLWSCCEVRFQSFLLFIDGVMLKKPISPVKHFSLHELFLLLLLLSCLDGYITRHIQSSNACSFFRDCILIGLYNFSERNDVLCTPLHLFVGQLLVLLFRSQISVHFLDSE